MVTAKMFAPNADSGLLTADDRIEQFLARTALPMALDLPPRRHFA